MSRLGKDIVEMQKIVNEIPFDTIWVHWETDIYFDIIDMDEIIFIRTPDKILTGCEAYLVGTHSVIKLDTGTYTIGTYSMGTQSGEYKIIVGTSSVGYVEHVFRGDNEIFSYSQLRLPNIGEVEIEWETSESNLFPDPNPKRKGGYGVYATYSMLNRRNNINRYWITDEYGNLLYDSDGNVISIK